jgi:hypothetical protein
MTEPADREGMFIPNWQHRPWQAGTLDQDRLEMREPMARSAVNFVDDSLVWPLGHRRHRGCPDRRSPVSDPLQTTGNSFQYAEITRRDYLIVRALEMSGDGLDRGDLTNVFLAREAVDSTALAHPEWDMDERKTFEEWYQQADAADEPG